ncbi:MAG TPA: hypothetical protein VGY54_25010 [Polyangiaceae bacterium]|nr:hypothetical protein [Polyangiaceae bacterium]
MTTRRIVQQLVCFVVAPTFIHLGVAGCAGHAGRPTLPPPEYEDPGSGDDRAESQSPFGMDGGAQRSREASP